MTSTQSVTLYGTSACHLCEQAEALLLETLAIRPQWHYLKVDISESDQLFERYGLLIPVLALADGRELRWPFSAGALVAFLDAARG